MLYYFVAWVVVVWLVEHFSFCRSHNRFFCYFTGFGGAWLVIMLLGAPAIMMLLVMVIVEKVLVATVLRGHEAN